MPGRSVLQRQGGCTHRPREREDAGTHSNHAGLFTNRNGDEKVFTRNEYTIIAPGEQPEDEDHNAPENSACPNITPAIVVEGPGKRGEVVHVCANPQCEVHGKSGFQGEQRAAAREREEQWKRGQEEREKNCENNGRLLDAVLERVPKALTRADYEMLVFAAIGRLDYEHLDAVCTRYKIDTDHFREPDAVHFELEQRARGATEPQLIRMLIELALLPSGYSDEPLQAGDPLVGAASRYGVFATKDQPKQKGVKCTPKTKSKQPRSKATSKATVVKQKTAKKGGAA